MGRIISFFIPGNPNAQKRHRDGKGYKYDPSAGDKKDFLILCHKHKPEAPFTGPLKVDILATYSRPKSHYRTGKYSDQLKENAPYWKITTPDKDNIEKFIYDSLKGVYWKDDAIICDGRERKIWGDVPGIQLDVMELEG